MSRRQLIGNKTLGNTARLMEQAKHIAAPTARSLCLVIKRRQRSKTERVAVRINYMSGQWKYYVANGHRMLLVLNIIL